MRCRKKASRVRDGRRSKTNCAQLIGIECRTGRTALGRGQGGQLCVAVVDPLLYLQMPAGIDGQIAHDAIQVARWLPCGRFAGEAQPGFLDDVLGMGGAAQQTGGILDQCLAVGQIKLQAGEWHGSAQQQVQDERSYSC